jgi:CHAD domain-containing protein
MLERANASVAQYLDGVLAGESEAIHQFRISLRRLRALLRLYQPLLQQNWFKRYREELRFLAHSMGVLRDIDVLQQNLADGAVMLDDSMGDALAPLREALAERRRQQHEQIRALLKSPRYEALLHSLPSDPFKQASADVRMTPAKRIEPLARALQHAGAGLSRDSSPAEFHRLRVRIKRLRYALESLETEKNNHTKRSAKELRVAQRILGLHHDLVTAMSWLHEFAASAMVPGPSLLAAGALYEVLRRRCIKVSERVWKQSKSIRTGAVLDDIVRGFHADIDPLKGSHKVKAA